MSKIGRRLVKKLNQKDQEINRLKGMYDCAVGNPSQSDDEDYQEGYSQQYHLEQQQTNQIMESF